MVFQFLAGLFGGAVASQLIAPVQRRIDRGLKALDPVELLSAASYADALRLDYINQEQYLLYMRELGFSNNQAHIFYANTKAFLSKEDNAIRRVAKSFEAVFDYYDKNPNGTFQASALSTIKEQYCKAMYGIGYDESESVKMFEALRPVPTFSILLEWLAKEVFEPTVRARFLLDSDYPKIWASLMESLGVPDFEAKAYWAAHWNHPALGQIGDMFTRFRSDRTNRSEEDAQGAGSSVAALSMTKDDYTEALKLHEIAPYWRDRIIANSYRPLPLTTLQQIAQYGLKDQNWLKGRLEDYGYSSGNAQIILDTWNIKFPLGSKAPIDDSHLKQYERGDITYAECLTALTTAGLTTAAATFVTKLVRDKITLKVDRSKLQAWKRAYRSRNLDDAKLRALIGRTESDSSRVDHFANLVKASEDAAFSRLRMRDISRGYSDGKLTKAEARSEYEGLRTLDSDIDILLKIYEPDPDESS